jgi:hypothetical protein
MNRSIAELRNTSDDELIRNHDRPPQKPVVGVNYYLEELARTESATASNERPGGECGSTRGHSARTGTGSLAQFFNPLHENSKQLLVYVG